MTRSRKTTLAAAAVAATALLVGAGAAIAAGGGSTDDLSALADRIRAKNSFSAAVATKLGTTAAKLEAAITDAANDRIDAAVQAGSLSAADAETLRQAIADGDRLAQRIAQGAEVAKKLGVTEAKLDEAYAAVRKAAALERVDEAEKAGRITAEVADQMRERIEAADLAGFGAEGLGHGRHGGPGELGGYGPGPLGDPGDGGFGHGGRGLGPLDAPDGGSGSSSSDDGTSAIVEDAATVTM